MNVTTHLNSKQMNLLNDYVRSGRNESFIKQRINWFGVNQYDQTALYNQLIAQNKEVSITELDEEFKGLQICTYNLNSIIADGFSGEWKINVKRAAACGYLRVFSLNDRGLYFTARIKGFERLKNGKYKILFENVELQRHESKNLKFTRNVVRYINMPYKNAQRKNK